MPAKIVYRMWFFMFTEGKTAKFPLLQEMTDFKNYRHSCDIKCLLRLTVE